MGISTGFITAILGFAGVQVKTNIISRRHFGPLLAQSMANFTSIPCSVLVDAASSINVSVDEVATTVDSILQQMKLQSAITFESTHSCQELY